jgi:glutamate-1-semialdehyde 2,1-aminomutase
MGKLSEQLFTRAKAVIPGGVNSPVRAFKAVGGGPRFIASAAGSTITDVDGMTYTDYILSWGPMIVGHTHPDVVAAICRCAADGTSFGAPTELEIQLAEEVVAAVPSIEMVRMVSSGTEATMSAIRLARGFTKRDMILKFTGCYHGHVDSLLVEAGSGVITLGIPGTPGIPEDFARHTMTLPYNDLAAVDEAMKSYGDRIAAIIVEPVVGNMGCVLPAPGFLAGLRSACDRHGSLLIFDEVITGFRLAYGGAQQIYGITPDLTCLGKIIGGGLPVGAYGGRAEIMRQIAPEGPVYQAGTLSGNPLAMTAGLATLAILRQEGAYDRLDRMGARLGDGLAKGAADAGIPSIVNRAGSLVTLFFTAGPVTDYTSAAKADTARFRAFFVAMLERGHFIAPSQFEALFLSLAHTDEQIDKTVADAREVLAGLA